MQDIGSLLERLKPIMGRIERWRSDAALIATLADAALEGNEVKSDRLLMVEEKAGEIYAEIAAFDALTAEFAEGGEAEASLLAEVGDALRLVLMEITELGTSMYSVRSQLPAL